MRNWIIAVAVCMLTLPAAAQDVAWGAGVRAAPQPEPMSAEGGDLCESVSVLAEDIMRGRLNGRPMREAMALAADAGDADATALMQNLTVMAYREPDFQSPSVQQTAITEFGNRAYLLCRGR